MLPDGIIPPNIWQKRLAERCALIDKFLDDNALKPDVLWYYTPMALAFSAHLSAPVVVYDCMDELSLFKNPPQGLQDFERALLARATLVYTGGPSLYEAKRSRHSSTHCFPSSVDAAHFAQARLHPARLGRIAASGVRAAPRLGYVGVIDERIDLALLAEMADQRPGWSFVMVGPVVKIDPASLPRRPNIVWAGQKAYAELPSCLASFDIALLPFALNDSTRFISPTKTPEYLAAGLSVISTPIRDVVAGYGDNGLVSIAAAAPEFIAAAERFLVEGETVRMARQAAVDELLATTSWDTTWARMHALIKAAGGKPPRGSNVARGPGWRFDYAIVGAGFAGSVMAERLAGIGKRVLLIDRRTHIGGNAFDMHDEAGILIQPYGPHIFHTNAPSIVEYLSRFTAWRPYEHRVLAQVDGKLAPLPINRRTLNLLYGLSLSEKEAADFLAARAEPVNEIKTSEDVIVSKVGRDLYEKFFQGYTRKQWGMDASELDKSVIARIPTRTNDDDRYFTDHFQAMPANGFTRMFEKMLDHPNITRLLDTDYRDVVNDIDAGELIYTGPIDEYFDLRYGQLPYRSLEFRHETLDLPQYQPVAVVNYPDQRVPYTRITEFKHLTGQPHARTSICREYPQADGDPYYPIPRPENQELYRRYQALADSTPDVHFVGRLATYRYYNMDQVVGQALALFDKLHHRPRPDQTQTRAAATSDALV